MRIVHAHILPMEGAPIPDGFLRFENYRIAEVGAMADTRPLPDDLDVRCTSQQKLDTRTRKNGHES